MFLQADWLIVIEERGLENNNNNGKRRKQWQA
jgi:hypothetical protein